MTEIKICSIKKVDLAKLRKKANLSLRELERLSGVNFSTIHKYEKGIMVMPEDIWNRIALALDSRTNK